MNFRRREILHVLGCMTLSTFLIGSPLTPSAMAKSRGRPLAPGEATNLIKDLGDEAVAMLSNKSLSDDESIRQFRQLLNKRFALKGIARFVLGRYWRIADFPQRQRYLKLFEDYIVNSYAARFRNYDGEQERLGAVRIVYFMIECISMSLTQRSDFAASVRTAGGDLDKFLDTLEIKIRKIKPSG